MLHYFTHKLAYAFLTLFGVVSLVFILFNGLGDPARMMLDQNASAEQVTQVKHKYGFDKPLFKQYLYYLNDLSPLSIHSQNTADFTAINSRFKVIKLFKNKKNVIVLKAPYLRESYFKQGKKVSSIIGETLPNTTILAIVSISIAIVFGIFLGILSALYKDSFFDKSIALLSTIGMSIPSFFSAILFAWFFGFLLHQYTGLNMTGSRYEVDDFGEGVFIQWKNLILPAVVLGIRPLAVIIQLMRNSLLEVLNQDYIRTAKAKGLSQYQIIRKHALKNAMNPVVTAISGWFASLLAGAVFVEYIFGWNGLGKEIVNALNQSDLPVIMGAVLVIAGLFVAINILLDLVYAWLDPKVKLY